MYPKPQVSHLNGRSFECTICIWLDRPTVLQNAFPHNSQTQFRLTAKKFQKIKSQLFFSYNENEWETYPHLVNGFLCVFSSLQVFYICKYVLEETNRILSTQEWNENIYSTYNLWHIQHSNGRLFECCNDWCSFSLYFCVKMRSHPSHFKICPRIWIESSPFDWISRTPSTVSLICNS